MLESVRLALHQGSCIVTEISEYHADEQDASLETLHLKMRLPSVANNMAELALQD